MGAIIKKDTKVVVQGITGREGRRAAKEMMASGITVSCGVTPGKGGEIVEDRKVFDSIKDALIFDPLINTSVLYVPPLLAYDAAMEAMEHGIRTLVLITENVPIRDASKMIEYADTHGLMLIGPSSIGLIDTRLGKIGSIASRSEADMYSVGNVGIISKSGGMCAETALALTNEGIGQSTVVGIGGDPLIGTTFVDMLKLFKDDPETEAIVIYGEIGGSYEEQAAEALKGYPKPVVAFISGKFAETMQRSLALGHAGAIIENGKGRAIDKKKALKQAGVYVADFHHDIPTLVKKVLR